MVSKPRRPRKVQVDRIKAHVKRGPKPDGSGRWYWQAVIYEGGDQITVFTGWRTRAALVTELSDMVARGVLERRPTTDVAPIKTLRELVSGWYALAIEPRPDLSDYTRRNYKQAARHWITTSADVLARHVDLATMESHRDQRLRANAATSTVKRELRAMRTCWRWARERGLVPDRRLPMPALEEHPVRDRHTPSEVDVRRVLHALEHDDRPLKRRREYVRWPWLAVHLLAAAGARVGEIGRLRWEDVDLDQGLLYIQGKRTRRNRSGRRVVPIEPELAALVRTWRGRPDAAASPKPDMVLGVTSKTVEASLSGAYMAAACERAGVRVFTPHGLRRYAEDRLAHSGVDIAEYAAILGHSPAVALAHYRRATTESKRTAVQRASMSLASGGDVLPFSREN